MEYRKMLDRLYILLPQKSKEESRLEIPKPQSHIQGNKTFVKNFGQILKVIHRDAKHFMKYITKEAATSANIDSGRLVLNTKVPALQVNKIFDNYIKRFVLCSSCGKPDTKLVEQSGVKMVKCEACGALSPLGKV